MNSESVLPANAANVAAPSAVSAPAAAAPVAAPVSASAPAQMPAAAAPATSKPGKPARQRKQRTFTAPNALPKA